MNIYTGKTKKWHTPVMQTMSRNEVDRAIAASACSGYIIVCTGRNAKLI